MKRDRYTLVITPAHGAAAWLTCHACDGRTVTTLRAGEIDLADLVEAVNVHDTTVHLTEDLRAVRTMADRINQLIEDR
jgi:hypothetical protein